jgi:integrase
MLAQYYRVRPNNEWLFVTKYNEPYQDTKGVSKLFKKLLQASGVKDKTLYATRHTFTSMMLNSGFDKTWVKEMLGHSSDSTITEEHYFQYARNQSRVEAVNDFFKFEGLRNAN